MTGVFTYQHNHLKFTAIYSTWSIWCGDSTEVAVCRGQKSFVIMFSTIVKAHLLDNLFSTSQQKFNLLCLQAYSA